MIEKTQPTIIPILILYIFSTMQLEDTISGRRKGFTVMVFGNQKVTRPYVTHNYRSLSIFLQTEKTVRRFIDFLEKYVLYNIRVCFAIIILEKILSLLWLEMVAQI
jgi:hypothetical protein